jgi:DNA-binding XRE family transcriptional regulator
MQMPNFGGFTRYFGRELRRLREYKGWSREDLAEHLPWSVWTITSVERGDRKPPPGIGEHVDMLFGLPGCMASLEKAARDDPTPFGDFVGLEQRATSMCLFDARLVPGLFQIEAYARAVQRAVRPPLPTKEVERLVRERMDRRQVLNREGLSAVHVIIDESVLYRRVGGWEVMRDQLAALVEAAQRPNVTLQVLPVAAGEYDALAGPIILLRLPDEPEVSYAEGYAPGQLLDTPAEVFRTRQSFQQLAALALPPDISVEMIQACVKDLEES